MTVRVDGPMRDRYDEVLTAEALELPRRPAPRASTRRRRELLGAARAALRRAGRRRHARLPRRDQGRPRGRAWRVAEPAPGLVDRRVEITGPTDRKMTINALNSGAKVWLADLEDANTPLWENMVERPAQPARRASTGTIDFTSPEGKDLRAAPTTVGHDRGPAARLAPAGEAPPGRRRADLGQPGRLRPLLLPLRAAAARQRAGPVLLPAEDGEPPRGAAVERRVRRSPRTRLGIPRGTIRATVLIETYPAAFEMEEILYELRDHSAGLNAGRWDYMFSRHQEVPHPGPRTSCCPTATR